MIDFRIKKISKLLAQNIFRRISKTLTEVSKIFRLISKKHFQPKVSKLLAQNVFRRNKQNFDGSQQYV